MRLLRACCLSVCWLGASALVPGAGRGASGAPLAAALTAASTALLGSLEPAESDASAAAVARCAESVQPHEAALYAPMSSREARAEAICDLSRGLDVVEAAVVGPLLAGGTPSAADAELYPTLWLCEAVLPVHFGWTEWTDEALFYKRPRLHAWYELMRYEPGVAGVAAELRAQLDALGVDWAAVAQDVPTHAARKTKAE